MPDRISDEASDVIAPPLGLERKEGALDSAPNIICTNKVARGGSRWGVYKCREDVANMFIV